MTIEQNAASQEIIDATQNALINAADKVSEIIETAETAVGHEHEIFYQSPEFWVAVSFVLVVVLLARPIGKLLNNMLNKRIDGIARRISDAAQLKDDAQKMLAEYERKFINAQEEANNILKKAKKEVELVKKENLEKLEQDMKQRQLEVANRIEASQNEALKEVSDLTVELTIDAVKTAILQKLDDKAQNRLIDDAISKLDKAI